MTKLRVLMFLLTIVVVGIFGFFLVLYARGYRINQAHNNLTATGLMVVNSDPNGAQIVVDNKVNNATNATLSLAPGTYDVQLKKQGYLNWEKKMTVQDGIVTEIDASLFPQAASLNPLTFAGAINPQVSPDYSKIVYGADDGIWVIETINLPLGFNSQPIKITDLVPDLNTKWQWSPDSRQVLITTETSNYLLNISSTTLLPQLTDITGTLPATKLTWKTTQTKELDSLLSKLPSELQLVFQTKTRNITFSPDQTKILYTATDSATITPGLISPLPGSSTQTETRDIKKDGIYVFDLKEDRNFQITDIDIAGNVYWFPTSRNLLIPEKDKVVISDYDNTNKQTVYGGSYVYPNAFPTPNTNRIFILTNLGAIKASPNLYSLNLR
jgi:hypothetical protein